MVNLYTNITFVTNIFGMSDLKTVFDSFSTRKIFVIGDVMIDSYMWGKTNRISPEAPVPVVSIVDKENRMGGAANVGINVKSLDAEIVLCAVIGNDSYGDLFRELLKKRGMSDIGIIQSPYRPTTVKTRIIASNQHLLRVDEEESRPLSAEIESKFIKHTLDLISSHKPNAIIIEDYDKGNITPTIISEIVSKANDFNIPVLVDPKKRNFDYFKDVTIFKPNFKELVDGLKIEISKDDTKNVLKAVGDLRKKLNAKFVMTTLSDAGVVISDGENYFSMPAQKREIADVSGAGDTVISVAAVCLASGLSAFECAAISNIAGGLVCEKVGVIPVEKTLLLDECINLYGSDIKLKLIPVS